MKATLMNWLIPEREDRHPASPLLGGGPPR
jgi:hypothetical protein